MSNFTFSNAPVLKRGRSRFDLSHNVFTSGSLGRLYPFLCQEVYPGDQFKIKQKGVFRTSVPFIRPIFDNIYVDFSYFFVPYRLISDDWEDCITGGSGNPNEWVTPEETDLPTYGSAAVVQHKSVLDYLGFVPGKSAMGLSCLPARAVAKIWNDWFRDENVDLPVNIQKGGYSSSEAPSAQEWAPNVYNGACPPVSKFHDYFTTSLRKTQKGSPVEIPLTGAIDGTYPVNTGALSSFTGGDLALVPKTGSTGGLLYTKSSSAGFEVALSNASAGTINNAIGGSNLVVNVDDVVNLNPLMVNDLRFAFALQKVLERSARSGSRYTEYIHSSFGVTSPDARLQRSEYLGGSRTPINVQQVAQTSASGAENKLAELGAFSLTNNNSGCSKAFVEHGYIIGLFCLRQSHTYQQGIEKYLTRKSRYDFYDTALQNIGEQPVFTGELFRDGTTQGNVFGYQEAWADLRYRPNRISGQMRSSDTDSFDVYHLGDDYATAPTLSSAFIHETRTYVDRALGLTSSSQFNPNDVDQFLVDIHLDIKAIRVLPTYSVPSLIDHN